MNPCPCGYYPDMNKCRCTPGEVSHYLGKISQPLLDRMDLCADVSEVSYEMLNSRIKGESSAVIRERVERTQDIQNRRYSRESINFNGELRDAMVEQYCQIEPAGRKLLERAFSRLRFSARAYHKVLKVARTIADMEQSHTICASHVGEALSYRAFDKKYWR